MNQILSVEDINKSNEKKRNKKANGSTAADIKKVVRFFSLCILIFGMTFIGQGSYAIYKNMNSNENIVSGSKGQLPTIDIRKDGNDVIISASHTKEISKLLYNWNNTQDIEIEGNGTNYIEERIELPVGNNILNIRVTDIEGNENSYQKEYITDATKPQISIQPIDGTNKIRIISKDNIALSYITYRWNEEEETKIEAKETSKAQIEIEIDIPRGYNKLIVVSVNTNNISETKEQEINATTKPKVSITQDGQYLVIKGTDDEAMKKIEYTLNGKQYLIDYSSVRSTVIEYRQEMTPGENRISLKAYNFYDVEESFEGICVYNP